MNGCNTGVTLIQSIIHAMRGMLAARRSQIAIVHLLLNRGDRRSGKKRGDRRERRSK